ncbi:MAG: DUF2929 family protein [Lactobacillus sp.]|nr:DUF2929 family protein [Lactobacillus sp.]
MAKLLVNIFWSCIYAMIIAFIAGPLTKSSMGMTTALIYGVLFGILFTIIIPLVLKQADK